MSKLKNLDKLSVITRRLKKEGRKIVFTNGCFDILHAGHVKCLGAARNLGDVLVVGLNSDSSVRRLKGGGRPVLPQKDRAEILCGLESVDYCVIFDESTPLKTIMRILPDVLVKGADYGEDGVVGEDFMRESGGRTVLVPLVKGRSTSDIIRRIKSCGGVKNKMKTG